MHKCHSTVCGWSKWNQIGRCGLLTLSNSFLSIVHSVCTFPLCVILFGFILFFLYFLLFLFHFDFYWIVENRFHRNVQWLYCISSQAIRDLVCVLFFLFVLFHSQYAWLVIFYFSWFYFIIHFFLLLLLHCFLWLCIFIPFFLFHFFYLTFWFCTLSFV